MEFNEISLAQRFGQKCEKIIFQHLKTRFQALIQCKVEPTQGLSLDQPHIKPLVHFKASDS